MVTQPLVVMARYATRGLVSFLLLSYATSGITIWSESASVDHTPEILILALDAEGAFNDAFTVRDDLFQIWKALLQNSSGNVTSYLAIRSRAEWSDIGRWVPRPGIAITDVGFDDLPQDMTDLCQGTSGHFTGHTRSASTTIADVIGDLLHDSGITSSILFQDSDDRILPDNVIVQEFSCASTDVSVTQSALHTLVVHCPGRNITQMLSPFTQSHRLMNPLLNVIVVSPEPEVEDDLASNVEVQVSVRDALSCQIAMAGDTDNENQEIVGYNPFVIRDYSRPWNLSGYCIDLFDVLAHTLDFSFEIEGVSVSFGYVDENGTWHGALTYIIDGRTDMVLTGLTISEERASVVDFSYPFWEETVGLITLTLPKDQFYLYKPLKSLVWLSFLLSALFVSIVVAWMETRVYRLRLDKGRYPFRDLQQSCWYVIGAVWNQGGDLLPRSPGARALVISLWLVVMVILVTYSANLVSFLTVNENKMPFTTLQGAIDEGKVPFKMSAGGAVRGMLSQAQEGPFVAVWKRVMLDPEGNLVHGLTAAVRNMILDEIPAVVFSDYSSAISRALSTGQCNWGMLDDTFLPLGFGIAFPQGSPYKPYIDKAIMEMHEAGILNYLKRKYFNELSHNFCSEDFSATASALGVADMWPAFAVLGSGLVVAGLCLFLERLRQTGTLITHVPDGHDRIVDFPDAK